MNFDLFGKLIPEAPIEESKPSKNPQKGVDYAAYGLQTTKSTHEKGNSDGWFCPWCICEDGKGAAVSLCFVNWVICPNCIEKGLNQFPSGNSLTNDKCFRCDKENQIVFTSPTKGFPLCICKPCLQSARTILENHIPNLNEKTNQLNLMFNQNHK